ncbi:MAG: hypothetical protein ACE5RT_07315, partial [Nitrosopumilaceae archaeon]
MKILYVLFLIPFLLIPAFAENAQVLPTEKGTLNVDFSTDPLEPNPNESLKMKIDFINPVEKKIQVHIDYTLSVTKDGKEIFAVPFSHTSKGSVTIPLEIKNEGRYNALIGVEGIWFNPIPREEVSFDFVVGNVQTNGGQISIPEWIKNNAGWWADGLIGDSDFVSGIQFLIEEGIMTIPETQSGNGESQDIPGWIKNNAGWWADGLIGDS